MKKQRIVNTPERVVTRPAKVKKIVDVFCDICSIRVDTSRDNRYGSGGHDCWICGRDICRNQTCFVNEEDPDDCNDSIRICILCHPLRYKKYLIDYYKMLDRHAKEEEDFIKMIKKESLNESPIS